MKNFEKNIVKKTEIVDIITLLPKVIVSEKIIHKIQYLCDKVPNLEWSGILLYTVEGTIKYPQKLVIILKDIIPMNVKSAVYTEYKYHEKDGEDSMIDYFSNNPIALEENWRTAHIHSHNRMNVFFSGTDLDEIKRNSALHDYYLSIIVNNNTDIIGKIAICSEYKKTENIILHATDENGVKYNKERRTVTFTSKDVEIIDCKIMTPFKVQKVFDENFTDLVSNILEKAKKEEREKLGKISYSNLKYSNNFKNDSINKLTNEKVYEEEFEELIEDVDELIISFIKPNWNDDELNNVFREFITNNEIEEIEDIFMTSLKELLENLNQTQKIAVISLIENRLEEEDLEDFKDFNENIIAKMYKL